MGAIGYIRQSRRADLDIALSYDSQLAAIKRLAARDGTDPESLTILADMGRSGAGGKEHLRSAYQSLLEAIEGNGHGTTVYALSMSRIARSVDELRRVYALAAQRGIRIVFEKEGEIRFGEPVGKLLATLVGAVYEFERELAVDRAADNVAERKRRGDVMGRRPYGSADGQDPSVVVDAYRRAGSYNGAASLLNSAGIPSQLGRLWRARSVSLIIEREAPELVTRRQRQGAKSVTGFALSGLLRCAHDGAFLTGQSDKGHRYIRYHCNRANGDPSHPSPKSVRESHILPWIKAEAARLRTPEAYARDDSERETERAELDAKRLRIVEMYADGAMTRDEYQRRLEAVLEAQERLQDASRIASVVTVPEIDWTWAPRDLNSVLRAIWEYVTLDDTMTPVDAKWTVPEWRAE